MKIMAEKRRHYVPIQSSDPGMWLTDGEFSKEQGRRIINNLQLLELGSSEDESPYAYTTDDTHSAECGEPAHNWITGWILFVILCAAAGFAVGAAIELWRAPWSDIFDWMGDHRAACIQIGTISACVLGSLVALFSDD